MRELAMIEFCDQGLRRGSKFFDYEEDQDTSKKSKRLPTRDEVFTHLHITPKSFLFFKLPLNS